MLENQLIVSNVGIEGSNQIISVLVSVGDRRITFTAVRIRIPQPIHPVSGPTLSKMWTREHFVYGDFHRMMDAMFRQSGEPILLLDCWGQPG